jgi:hypothetical protein
MAPRPHATAPDLAGPPELAGSPDGGGDPDRSGAHLLPTRPCPTCGQRFPADFAVCPHDATPLGAPTADTDPLLGDVLAGTYRITRLLAGGGMGQLYEAEHTRLPRTVGVQPASTPSRRMVRGHDA